MRVFLFGSTFSIVSSCVFSRNKNDLDVAAFASQYLNKTYSLLGTIIIWIFFPALCLVDVYNSLKDVSNDLSIVPIAALNMWLGLISGAIGVFSLSIIIHGKFRID